MTWLSGRSRRPWLQEQDLDNLVNEDPRPAVPNELFTTILPGMGQEVDAPAEERTSNLRTSAVNRLLGVIQVGGSPCHACCVNPAHVAWSSHSTGLASGLVTCFHCIVTC